MTSVRNVFLDMGDIYTKFHVLDEDNNLEYNVCFPTVVKRETIPNATCSYFQDADSGSYINVGWNAASDLGFDDMVNLKFKATVFEVFRKILFDYIEEGSTVNIHFIAAEASDDSLFENEKIYKDYDFPIKGYVNGLHITKRYTINVTNHMVSDIIKSFFTISPSLEEHNLILMIDIGFKKTKLFIIDTKSNNVTFKKFFHGFDYYLIKLNDHFKSAGLNINPFIFLKELERNNALIETNEEVYDITTIIENARYDLSIALISDIEEVLQEYYHSFLAWPGFLYIAGGGSILNGEIIKAGLASRFNQFNKTFLVESRPRDYLVRTCFYTT